MKLQRITNNIYDLKSNMMDNNTYLLIKNNKCLIIDPSFSGKDLISYFKDNKAIKPMAIILTHAHFDHCFDISMFIKEHNIPVYIYEKEKITYEKYDYASLVDLTLPRFDKNIVYFEDLDLKIDDFNLKILFTPGHTSGGITIIWDNCAFVGDTLFYMSYGRTDLINSSQKDLIKSIKKLYKALKDDMYVLPGHSRWGKFKDIKEANEGVRRLVEENN